MITIRFNGGIGNQIFQYAFYKYLQKRGVKIQADITTYSRQMIHGGFLLDKIFPNNSLTVPQDNFDKYYKQYSLSQKLENKLTHHVGNHYYEAFFDNWKQVFPFIMNHEDCYLDGWWQYAELALSMRTFLLGEIVSPRDALNNDRIDYLQEIKSTESISLHIRRGDYLLASSVYGNICTESYYKNAIKTISSQIKRPVFFVFSDDEAFCKKVFNKDNFVIIPSSEGKNAYIDLLMMSKCRHHIIANSSFSWWGTALSEMNGINIMPSRYNNKDKENHLIIPNSILIDNHGSILNT